jgi:hypothetical protein
LAGLATLTLQRCIGQTAMSLSVKYNQMEKIPKTADLITSIRFVLEKSRGSLADDDVLILQNACNVLSKLDDVEPEEAGRLLTEISVGLIRVLTRPDVLAHIAKWVDHLFE